MIISYLLPFKLAVVPALMWLISYAGRKWGPIAAGNLSAFPVVVGPALFFVAIEQGIEFASKAAISSIAGVLALIAFSLTYVLSAKQWAWWACIGIALTAYTFVIVMLHSVNFSLAAASALVLFVLTFVQLAFPKWQPLLGDKLNYRFDTPLRMLIGCLLVYGLTVTAAKIGPTWSGIFAMFPVTGSVLLVFSHVYQGRNYTMNLIHGMFLGWCSIAAFCTTLSLTLPQFGIAIGFTIALAAAIAAQGIAYRIRNT